MEKSPDARQALEELKPRRRWVEPVTALLMALATVGTAWCSYESAAWTRKSNRSGQRPNAPDREPAFLNREGRQAAPIHTAMFMQLLAPKQAGNEKLAQF